MLKEFSTCFLFLVLFIYLGITTVVTFMVVNVIGSYENLKELRLSDACENCGVKLISILIAVAVLALTFILSGCLGTCRNKKPITKFLMFFFILFCLEMAVGGLVYLKRHTIGSKVQENMKATFNQYTDGVDVKKAIDHLQQKYHCCGVNGPSDWSHFGFNTYQPFEGWKLPQSCCDSADPHTNKTCTTESTNYFKTGCYIKICDAFTQNRILIGIFVFIQSLGLILGLYLSCTTKHLRGS